MLVLNDFLNSIYDFLNFDREVMDNLITTIIYVIYIYLCKKWCELDYRAYWLFNHINYL